MAIDPRRRQALHRLEIAAVFPHIGWRDQPRVELLVVRTIEPAPEGPQVGAAVLYRVRGLALSFEIGQEALDLLNAAGVASFALSGVVRFIALHEL